MQIGCSWEDTEMRIHIAITILFGMLGSACFSHAQSCYTPVASWQGNYSLSTSGSNTCSVGSRGTEYNARARGLQPPDLGRDRQPIGCFRQ